MGISESVVSGKKDFDAVVIGSGFGGLGAALSLAERGLKVGLIETLRYPGGCAGTFERSGYRFEAGATLSSGFSEKQLFKRWIDQHHLDIELEWLDPVVHFRTPKLSLDIPSSRDQLIESLCALPDAPQEGIKAFFTHQTKVADALWALFDDSSLLPPWTLRSLLTHLCSLGQYRPVLKDVNTSLYKVLNRYGIADFKPLTLYLDALCQITVQCGTHEAEAPFALSTMDYYGRGTAHVIGGLGKLASELCKAIKQCGGEVMFSNRAKKISPLADGGYQIETRRGAIIAEVVISNLLPKSTRRLLPDDFSTPKWFNQIQSGVEKGWGAAMLYMVAETPKGFNGGAEHWQLIGDEHSPLIEGNHVFCSISSSKETDRAPVGSHTLTLSTHIPMATLRELPEAEKRAYIDDIHAKMRSTFSERCPEWSEQVYFGMSASPRTFERFTAREEGLVGGIPKRRGWHNYLRLGPRRLAKGLYMVGDSTFPGQSTLATATGGERTSEMIMRREFSRRVVQANHFLPMHVSLRQKDT